MYGIDLAVEIISPDDPDRDLIDKRSDYAAAGISEYWIVDPRDDSIQVLELCDGAYQQVNTSTSDETTSSILLAGFEIDVKALFKAARTQ